MVLMNEGGLLVRMTPKKGTEIWEIGIKRRFDWGVGI